MNILNEHYASFYLAYELTPLEDYVLKLHENEQIKSKSAPELEEEIECVR